ncbi:hypothetical protein RHMOL_Rhmol04G0187300 [Rhododendron molle]|uniref:Uncharacterized protein n=1 Tax=Rhododendron molle TaxID=49168 RepID=A0ACC0P240_RHOML|nr:hypothetical protein RHMOL_Rhmol04G0187300 [Rhododendron molle]
MHSPSLSAGAVIGKKGKVVEKIRKETGCRISVLSSVKSPHSEEIIEVCIFHLLFLVLFTLDWPFKFY